MADVDLMFQFFRAKTPIFDVDVDV